MSEYPIVSVSSWPLHQVLGSPRFFGPGELVTPYPAGSISLTAVPGALAERGYRVMEICHFHLPSISPDYLEELRQALDTANVQLLSLLVDAGDITHPESGARDADWIAAWFSVAKALGAERVRVIAGKTSGEGALELACQRLSVLAEKARGYGLKLTTENWFGVTDNPEAVLEILDRTGIGFNLDFGNWPSPRRYEDLERIAARAETAHAKADFTDDGHLEKESYSKLLDIMKRHGFNGPFTLVATADGENPWEGLDETRRFIEGFYAG